MNRLITAIIAVALAHGAMAQEQSPSWRADTQMPTRVDVPERPDGPEMEFTVDRSSLMNGFGSADDDSADEIAVVEDSPEPQPEETIVIHESSSEPAAEAELTEQTVDVATEAIADNSDNVASELSVDETADLPENPVENQPVNEAPAVADASVDPEPVTEATASDTMMVDEQPLDTSSLEVAYVDTSSAESLISEPEIEAQVAERVEKQTTGVFKLIARDQVQPEYPREAYLKNEEGWVELEVTVGMDGSVTDASIVSARPKRVFERSALRAVKKTVYRSPSSFGLSSPQTSRIRIDFNLDS